MGRFLLTRRIRRDDAGITLVELMVTIGLLSVVLSLFLTVLVSVQTSLTRQATRSITNDNARQAVQELDREIRSGNVLYDPNLESDAVHYIYPGMSLRIYTQSNAPTREVDGLPGERCVQWRIKRNASRNEYELQRREWAQQAGVPVSGSASGWNIVATDVMNRAVSPQHPAFTVDPAKRIVNISILANNNATNGVTAQVDTTVEGRNTVYDFPKTLCGSENVATALANGEIPPYPTPDPAES